MNFSCSKDEYLRWYNGPYEDRLSDRLLLALISANRKDKDIWKIMDFDNTREAIFSGSKSVFNGQVMEVSGKLCRQSLLNLKLNLAGKHDPINDRDIHDVMCSEHCSLNDRLRFLSMNRSRCDCLQLSLSEDDPMYKEEGSFCRENSGNYLCADVGKCLSWECSISDFGCKRVEYNQIEIPLRGFGDDCNMAPTYSDVFTLNLILLTVTAIIQFI